MKFYRITLFSLFCGLLLGASLSAADDPSQALFRVNFTQTEVQLDPQKSQTALEAQLFTALYEGLLDYDPRSLRPAPGAAQNWEFSPDGLTLTFTLRSGLKFDDGTPLSSKDFLESWFREISPLRQAPYASLLDEVKGVQDWREGRLKDPSQVGFSAPAPDKLVVQLREPAPHILSILSHYAFVPVHPSLRADKPGRLPVGNGPYRLDKATATSWLLVKNPLYWDSGNVKIPRIEVTFRDDAEKVTQDFQEGRYDWLADGLDGSALINTRIISATPLFGTSFFYFNAGQAPWNDERVRRALILLLPLEDLRKNYLQPTSVLVPGFEGYPSPQGIEKSDPDAAYKLLEEAGFPKGKNLPAVNIVLPSGGDNAKLGDAFVNAWKPLGVTVNVQVIEGRYYDKIATVDHTIGYYSWIGDFLDPMTFLELWKGGSSLNTFGFKQAEYDDLLVQAAKQTSEERLKTLAQAEGYLLQKGLIIPLSHTPGFNFIDRDAVGGWYPNPLDIHPFKNLYLKPAKPPKNSIRFDLSSRVW